MSDYLTPFLLAECNYCMTPICLLRMLFRRPVAIVISGGPPTFYINGGTPSFL